MVGLRTIKEDVLPEEENLDQEEPIEGGVEIPEDAASAQGSVKVRRPYSKIAIELDEQDLESKGVQKLLLAEISRLETENAQLCNFRDEFHSRDKDCAKFGVQLQKSKMVEILYTIAVAVGAALLGLTPSISGLKTVAILTAFAICLFVFAILAKWKGGKDEG